MNNAVRFIVSTLLLVNLFAPVAVGQTRKRPAPSRRAKKAAVAPKERKPVAPCPASPAKTTPSGLTYVVTRRGEGNQLKPGETVSVHYTGMLGNGMKFDSSLDRDQPIEFELGAGRVIKGWDEGVAQLRVGDQATLIIPPQLGYGARGAGGVIPPDATLIFIIEVVGVKEMTPPPAGAPPNTTPNGN